MSFKYYSFNSYWIILNFYNRDLRMQWQYAAKPEFKDYTGIPQIADLFKMLLLLQIFT